MQLLTALHSSQCVWRVCYTASDRAAVLTVCLEGVLYSFWPRCSPHSVSGGCVIQLLTALQSSQCVWRVCYTASDRAAVLTVCLGYWKDRPNVLRMSSMHTLHDGKFIFPKLCGLDAVVKLMRS
jgi:anti-sigma-K factor RskA